jgi:hypothetical protein
MRRPHILDTDEARKRPARQDPRFSGTGPRRHRFWRLDGSREFELQVYLLSRSEGRARRESQIRGGGLAPENFRTRTKQNVTGTATGPDFQGQAHTYTVVFQYIGPQVLTERHGKNLPDAHTLTWLLSDAYIRQT